MTNAKTQYIIAAVMVILVLVAGYFGIKLPTPPIPEPLPGVTWEGEDPGGLGLESAVGQSIKFDRNIRMAQDLNVVGDVDVDSTLNVDSTSTFVGAATFTAAPVWNAATMVFEGATADAYETTLSVTDPTADRTVTVPDAGGTVMLSSLATNGVDAANAVTGASNALLFEGATANEFEISVSPADPGADVTLTLPAETAAVMVSSLVTNATDAANAFTVASNGLVFEGATANEFEGTVTVTDPTADRTWTLPDASGTVMLSSLATNGADAANAVTGASNALVFEGATADAYETSIVATDPTADRTITLPNTSGTVTLGGAADAADAWWPAGQDFKYEGSSVNDHEAMLRFPADPAADAIYSFPSFSGYAAMNSADNIQLVWGSDTVTGTLALTHGLTTPVYALCTMGTDPADDQEDRCTVTIAGDVVTAKVWKEAATPTAGDSGVTVYWLVGGAP